jgi:SAM-dependent methyltransferase
MEYHAAVLRLKGVLALLSGVMSEYPEFNLEDKRVLDIGCGTGNGVLAANLLGAKEVTGVDIKLDDYGDNHIEWLARNYEVPLYKMEFIEDNIENPRKLTGRKFDIIFSYDVWEHISNPRAALLQAEKLLAPGGLLLISVAPLYFSPIGSHLWDYYPGEEFPWAHLILPDDQMMKEKNIDPWIWEHYQHLNKLTISQFESYYKEAGLCPIFNDYQSAPRSRLNRQFLKKLLPEKTSGITRQDLTTERMIVLLRRESEMAEPANPAKEKAERLKRIVRRKIAAVQKKVMILPDGYIPADPTLCSDKQYIDLAYRMLLGRKADQDSYNYFEDLLHDGKISRSDLLQLLVESVEYKMRRFNILEYIHKARLEMVQTLLPPAEVIVDLGGASPSWQEGCLYGMGYPHRSSKLMIVDLPPNVRLLNATEKQKIVTDYEKCGRIEYHYFSMSKLDFIPAASTDLVWSGESIEHITEKECEECLQQVWRILKPGGYFCLDTPNRLITKLQTPNRLIHPEHKIEYTPTQLKEKLVKQGFEILEMKGLLPMPESAAAGSFNPLEIPNHPLISEQTDICYLFYIKARKPV